MTTLKGTKRPEYGYVAAGYDSIVAFIQDRKFEQNTTDKLAELCNKMQPRVLISFGQFLSEYKGGKKEFKPDHYYKRFVTKILDYVIDRPWYSELFIDSGGFQVANGYIGLKNISTFTTLFQKFLNEQKDKFDYTFSLDLPPYRTDAYADEHVCYEYNKVAYDRIFVDLSPEVTKKIHLVKHYRTPSLQRTWTKIFKDERLMENFNSNCWSIAGIVRSSKAERHIPVISIAMPMTEVADWAVKTGTKKFRIHMLANCAPIQIFLYEFYKRIMKDYYDLEITITYDSVGSIMQIGKGRKAFHYMDGNCKELSFSSKVPESNRLELTRDLNRFLESWEVDYRFEETDQIYNISEKTGKPSTFAEGIYPATILMYLDSFRDLEKLCRDFVNDNIQLFYDDKINEFTSKCVAFGNIINKAKLSSTMLMKMQSMPRVLNMFRNLDVKQANELIMSYTGADEIKYNDTLNIPDFLKF